ncbi:unnamed protein product [Victoria cruziana]
MDKREEKIEKKGQIYLASMLTTLKQGKFGRRTPPRTQYAPHSESAWRMQGGRGRTRRKMETIAVKFKRKQRGEREIPLAPKELKPSSSLSNTIDNPFGAPNEIIYTLGGEP